MRALGLDLGSKRIGVAVSDGEGLVATPLKVVQRTGDRRAEHRAIASLVREWEVEVVVVGMPYSLDGSRGPMALRMGAEADEMGDRLGVPVETYDERLTTVTAERSLREQDLRGPERRRVVDMVAATVMLQAWLDGRRARSGEPVADEPEIGAPGTEAGGATTGWAGGTARTTSKGRPSARRRPLESTTGSGRTFGGSGTGPRSGRFPGGGSCWSWRSSAC